jgi:hypothetical protein
MGGDSQGIRLQADGLVLEALIYQDFTAGPVGDSEAKKSPGTETGASWDAGVTFPKSHRANARA